MLPSDYNLVQPWLGARPSPLCDALRGQIDDYAEDFQLCTYLSPMTMV
jgi:hypothetical protein